MASRWHWLSAVVLIGVVAGCGGPRPAPSTPGTTEQPPSTESAPVQTAAPSVTRTVPPEQRKRLPELSADQLCGLVEPETLGTLAFGTEAGRPREAGFDPPVRGCEFPARSGRRSVLIGTQPEGFNALGREEIALGDGVRGTRTQHAGDCTVYAPVAGATLQVTVSTGEPDTKTCQSAADIAQYTLSAITR